LELASIRNQGDLREVRRYIDLARPLIIKGDEDYWYILTCVESILGNTASAFDHLENAVNEEGFDGVWAWEDPDVQWIRDHPRFAEIIGPSLRNKDLGGFITSGSCFFNSFLRNYEDTKLTIPPLVSFLRETPSLNPRPLYLPRSDVSHHTKSPCLFNIHFTAWIQTFFP